jgi:hypothetical protein
VLRCHSSGFDPSGHSTIFLVPFSRDKTRYMVPPCQIMAEFGVPINSPVPALARFGYVWGMASRTIFAVESES